MDFGMLTPLLAYCVYLRLERTVSAGRMYLLSLHVPSQQVRALERLSAPFNGALKGRLWIVICFMASMKCQSVPRAAFSDSTIPYLRCSARVKI